MAGTHASQDADYNLAGPPSQQPHHDPHSTYYEEGYFAANPWMETQPPTNESFSLARTFPHKVRWGAKTPKQEAHPQNVPTAEKGQAEAASQVPAALNQRHEEASNMRDPAEGKRDLRDPRPDAYGVESYSLEDIKEQPGDDLSNVSTAHSPRGTSPADDIPPERPSLRHRIFSHYNFKGERNGIIADETIAEDLDPKDLPFNQWAVIRLYLQRPLAEWLGTSILMFLGISGNLAVTTSDKEVAGQQSSYWTWGFAVMLAIYIAGGASGAFLNPALTIMLSVLRGFPAKRVPVYILAQLLGAFTGALLAFAIYKDAILHMDQGSLLTETTARAFYSVPQGFTSNATAFFTTLLGTAVIGCSIMALGDSNNSPPGAGMHAVIIGLLTMAVMMSLGYSTGGCFNPVGDLGPRLATIAVGYPLDGFSARQNWWLWGPWCATITGALIGGLVYDLCIFKGGESPVNYSFGRWKIESLKNEASLTRNLHMWDKTRDIERRLESGEILDEPKVER